MSRRPDALEIGEEHGVYTKGLGETQIQVLLREWETLNFGPPKRR